MGALVQHCFWLFRSTEHTLNSSLPCHVQVLYNTPRITIYNREGVEVTLGDVFSNSIEKCCSNFTIFCTLAHLALAANTRVSNNHTLGNCMKAMMS